MPNDHQFGLFVQHENGSLWKGFFTDLEEAKRQAQELANRDALEYYVLNFRDFTEVARAFPRNSR